MFVSIDGFAIVTLVTGLVPDHHGIVSNTMRDPAIPGVTFSMSNRDAVVDPALRLAGAGAHSYGAGDAIRTAESNRQQAALDRDQAESEAASCERP